MRGESARLCEVARIPAFREAMTWQNPAAVANALDRVAAGGQRAAALTWETAARAHVDLWRSLNA